MALRTTPTLVGEILGNASVDPFTGNWDGVSSLTPYINAANAVISRVVTCAALKGIAISTSELELMESWMAAYFYTQMDPLYKSKSTQSASASFGEQSYKDAALILDPSGCLNGILSKNRAGGFWGGKTETQQLTYEERN